MTTHVTLPLPALHGMYILYAGIKLVQLKGVYAQHGRSRRVRVLYDAVRNK